MTTPPPELTKRAGLAERHAPPLRHPVDEAEPLDDELARDVGDVEEIGLALGVEDGQRVARLLEEDIRLGDGERKRLPR